MAMKAAKKAVCCDTSGCSNNAGKRDTLTCSYCGKCADSALHDDCDTAAGGLVSPLVAVCGDSSCTNNLNAAGVLVCTSCGHCGDCAFHDH